MPNKSFDETTTKEQPQAAGSNDDSSVAVVVIDTAEPETIKPSIVTPVGAAAAAAATAATASGDQDVDYDSGEEATTTAASSQNGFSATHVDNDDDDDRMTDDDTLLDDPMYFPLLQYTTLTNNVAGLGGARNNSSSNNANDTTTRCICTAVAQVLIQPAETIPLLTTTAETLTAMSSSTSSSSSSVANARSMGAAAAAAANGRHDDADDEEDGDGDMENPLNVSALLSSDLWKQPHFIMATGWQNGSVSLRNVQHHGMTVKIEPQGGGGSGEGSLPSLLVGATDSESHRLWIREQPGMLTSSSSSAPCTVGVSMDSTGTLLAAIDAAGTCCLWELKYSPSWQKLQVPIVTDSNGRDASGTAANAAASMTDDNGAPATGDTTVEQSSSFAAASSNKSGGGGGGGGGMFSNFMTALTGLPPSPEAESSKRATATTTTTTTSSSSNPTPLSRPKTKLRTAIVPCLAATVASTSRINYPAHWKAPTCLVLDPAHKKKSTKSFVVGFSDGRLLLTKRGGLFQRRNDTILYQGAPGGESNNNHHNASSSSSSSSYAGIECVAWRGNLVAWADASGMKLLDILTLTRIAHIDRPTGARPSLYPTLTPAMIQPHLVFETSSNLLVAWGDCLMTMQILESPTPGEGTSIAMRRTVQCTMAWELDCVAAGVAPLDEDHVVVLGIVPPSEDDDDEETVEEDGDVAVRPAVPAFSQQDGKNELEMQIVSRQDGTIRYADVLPQQQQEPIIEHRCWLESSFVLPRMDNASEWNEFKLWSGRVLEDNAAFDLTHLTGTDAGGSMENTGGRAAAVATPLGRTNESSNQSPNDNFGTNDNSSSPNNRVTRSTSDQGRPRNTFVDSHLQWNLKSITYENDDYSFPATNDDDDDDQNSVDSDDYGFVFRPLELLDDSTHSWDHRASAPVMVVVAGSDLIKATMSNVDDAVEHALVTQNRPALALKRALQHRRQLRRYKLSRLVEHYLEALLYMSPPYGEKTSMPSALSLRRMKLAIQAMPVLLGNQMEQWTKWATELEKLPGALFLLRKHLPVRDPILPAKLYEQVLRGMLKEYEQLAIANSPHAKQSNVIALDKEAAHHVLESLLAWGPTKGLKEYIKLYQYSRRHGVKSVAESLKSVEVALQRRYLQTAAGYLHFPIPQGSPSIDQVSNNNTPQYDVQNDDSQDTLFSLQEIQQWIAPRVPLIARKRELGDQPSSTEENSLTLPPNDRIYLEAMARLRIMQCRFDLALQAYLAIGACHSPLSMAELESMAIGAVQEDFSSIGQPIRIHNTSYDFVLGLVENHHLHRLLLDRDFIAKGKDAKGNQFVPLLALLRLIGLPRVGSFLMEHCTGPEIPTNTGPSLYETLADSKESQRPETLPMDMVAAQLESTPALMHWYLHLIFTKKPGLYVKFPNNSIPPDAVTELHRKHFQLYLDFSGESKNSAEVLSGTETYKVEALTTPLLSFLKAALPLGGISPIDVRRQLEVIRSEESTGDDDGDDPGSEEISSTFALELAHILEFYGDESEEEGLSILKLYLEGAKSVMLGVSYAQRQRTYSSLLWNKLINHCLKTNATNADIGEGGMLFGSLLEAAALSGADLARLVAKIPPGMMVEGLRPRLVAAVADYRLKVDIHQAATLAASDEQVTLLREVAHRARRGARFLFGKVEQTQTSWSRALPDPKGNNEDSKIDQPSILPKNLRPIERHDRRTFSLSLPLR